MHLTGFYYRWFRGMLFLLPVDYRLAYGDEILLVFQQLFTSAGRINWGVFVRECASLPSLALTIYFQKVRRWFMDANAAMISEKPSSWCEAWLAALPLLGLGLMGITDAVARLLAARSVGPLAEALRAFPDLFALLVFAGLNIGIFAGGLAGFPRWTYSYCAAAGVIILYMVIASLVGATNLIGILLGLPLLAVLLVLAVRRSWRPLVDFFNGMWRSFPRATFAFYSTMPFICWLSLDEMTPQAALPALVVMTLVFTLGALLYMRSRGEWRQMAVLLGGMSLGWFIITAATSSFWHLRQMEWMTEPSGPWYETLFPMLRAWLFLLGLFSLPVLRLLARRKRPA